MNKQLIKKASYAHPIEKVWQAISDEKEITAWFIKADFKAEQGYNYTFTHEDTQIVGEVLEVEQPHLLTYTWMVKGSNVPSTVVWELSEKDGKTTVMLTHTADGEFDEAAKNMFGHFDTGWDKTLTGLKEYLG